MALEPFQRSAETDLNLSKLTFFHGAKSSEDAAVIARMGFRVDFHDSDGRWMRDGNLGIGVYLTCNWKTALWFGQVLLRVSLIEGTRIFDASPAPDRNVLDGLTRRFGREVLTSNNPLRAIPSNKSLTFEELTALTRFHYKHTWAPRADNALAWDKKRIHHMRALRHCVSQLKKFGFHGYGDPVDDNGIVIFQPDRVRLDEVVADIPPHDYSILVDCVRLSGLTMTELRTMYPQLQTLKGARQKKSRRASP